MAAPSYLRKRHKGNFFLLIDYIWEPWFIHMFKVFSFEHFQAYGNNSVADPRSFCVNELHRGSNTELLDVASFVLRLVQLGFLSDGLVGIPGDRVAVDVRHLHQVSWKWQVSEIAESDLS